MGWMVFSQQEWLNAAGDGRYQNPEYFPALINPSNFYPEL
jgi:hypothetical protein